MRRCFLVNLLIFAFALYSVGTESKGGVLAKLKEKRDSVVREWNAEELVHMETINKINEVMRKRPVFFRNTSEERQTKALRALLASGKSVPMRSIVLPKNTDNVKSNINEDEKRNKKKKKKKIRRKEGDEAKKDVRRKYPKMIKKGKRVDNAFMENIPKGEGGHKTLRMRIVDAYLESSNAKHTAEDLFHMPPPPPPQAKGNVVTRGGSGEDDDDDVFNSENVDGVFLLIIVALPGVAAVVVFAVIFVLLSTELWKWALRRRKRYTDTLIGQGPPKRAPPPSVFFNSPQFHIWRRADVQIPGNKIVGHRLL